MCSPCVLIDVFVQLFEIGRTLFISHGDSIIQGASQLLGVPRIEDETAIETLGRASELGQHHDAMALALRCDVLVGHKVHPVACGRDEAHIRDSVQRNQFVEGNGLVEEMDGRELNSS